MFQAGQSFGKFYLVQAVGEGGTSRIFKAMQQPINRIVALKIPAFIEGAGILTPDEFLSEATLMARLEHANVVRIYDFGVSEDRAFICMEYVEGWNLVDLIEKKFPLSLSALLSIAWQTLEGLMHAHSQDVLHLDLSPANLLVSKQGLVKLSDFGMAGKKPQGPGKVIGTPAFLSPEHVRGKPGTPQSDLFSFASTVYFAATAEPLFDPGEDNMRIAEAFAEIDKAREHPPLDRLKQLPGPLAKLVLLSLKGESSEIILASLKETWIKSEGEARPEAVLRRELWAQGHAGSSPNTGDEDPSSDEALRERYFSLREKGRHRDAVALLEQAMRRQPDNPILRELLATPPAKAKSTPVTVAVEAGEAAPSTAGTAPTLGGKEAKQATPTKAARDPSPASTGKKILGIGFALGIVAVTLIFRTKEVPSKPVGAPAASQAQTNPYAAAQALQASEAPRSQPLAQNIAQPAGPTTASTASNPASPTATASALASASTRASTAPAKLAPAPISASSAKPAAPRPGKIAKTSAPIETAESPSALDVEGPAGTKVTVNDTLELTVPGPKQGWPLPAGLVNIVLTHPSLPRPITSSIFASADTLYVIRLEKDGGFSVSRRPR